MTRKLVWALSLIGVLVLLLAVQRGSVQVDLGFTAVRGIKAIVFFGFAAFGVVIGTMLK